MAIGEENKATIMERLLHWIFGPQVPVQVLVAHFTPSTFPLFPIISKKTTDLCRASWKIIMSQSIIDQYGIETSGISLFYNSFYERLDQLDGGKNFESVLFRFTKGKNKIAARGAVLIKLINSVLRIEESGPWVEFGLRRLGQNHAKMGIDPWQYSMYVETILLTLSTRLGNQASDMVMEAWVHLFAYVTKHILPLAIRNGKPYPLHSFHVQTHLDTAAVMQDKQTENIVKKPVSSSNIFTTRPVFKKAKSCIAIFSNEKISNTTNNSEVLHKELSFGKPDHNNNSTTPSPTNTNNTAAVLVNERPKRFILRRAQSLYVKPTPIIEEMMSESGKDKSIYERSIKEKSLKERSIKEKSLKERSSK
eukprot:gene7824-16000_t